MHAPAAFDLTGKTTLMEAAAVLRRCRLLITADSGLMHLAVAVGTKTISLFGSGIEKKWAPQGKNHLVINKRPECSPCTRFGYTPGCAFDVACLSAITVDEVVAAALTVLDRPA
jgi:heptosyltransferase-2